MQFEEKTLERALALSARRKVYWIVSENAGSHLREVERRCGLSHGVVKYHLDYLSRRGLIKQERQGDKMRYFPLGLKGDEKMLLGVLRSTTSRRVLTYLCMKNHASHGELAGFAGVSPPTLSWNMSRLEEHGMVRSERSGNMTTYSMMSDRMLVMKLLIAYRSSFLDSIIDGVVEAWG